MGWVGSAVIGKKRYTELDKTSLLSAENISPPDVKACAILEWYFCKIG